MSTVSLDPVGRCVTDYSSTQSNTAHVPKSQRHNPPATPPGVQSQYHKPTAE